MNSDYITKLCKRLEARRQSIVLPNQSTPSRIGKLSRFWALLHQNPTLAGIVAQLANNDQAKALARNVFGTMNKERLSSADDDGTHAAVAYQLLAYLGLDGKPPVNMQPMTLAEMLYKGFDLRHDEFWLSFFRLFR